MVGERQRYGASLGEVGGKAFLGVHQELRGGGWNRPYVFPRFLLIEEGWLDLWRRGVFILSLREQYAELTVADEAMLGVGGR